jgi:low temperature requirement protein LtrA
MPPADDRAGPDAPVRVSTLELFFDLVFAFTLTQLAATLAGSGISLASVAQVLLVFGAAWWMYGGYAWLTNTRTPDRTPERLLLLLGMAGFLVIGLAIRPGFSPAGPSAAGIFLGLGFLVVVGVHTVLYYRVNRNILRIAPFNFVSALLVLLAGVTGGLAGYLLWTAALAIQILSPLVVPVGGRFEIQPAHFAERHGALVIVALGESVAAVGIGAAGHPLDLQIVVAAVLGLGVCAALWWVYFGSSDDERAARAMTAAPRPRRPALALSAYFYPHIPILLGVVGLAAGVKLTIGQATQPHPAGQALAIGGGTALFLAGHAAFRRALHLGPAWPRLATAVFALATAALGATVAVEAQLIVLLAGLVVMLGVERSLPREAHGPSTSGTGTSGTGTTGPSTSGTSTSGTGTTGTGTTGTGTTGTGTTGPSTSGGRRG